MANPQFPNEHSQDGSFERQEDAFRAWVEASDTARFPAAAERYRLYVSLACPWAHRIIIARLLKGLEATIPMFIVDPIRNEKDGWTFSGKDESSPDPKTGFRFLKEAYAATDSDFSGRVTVPVLWDTQTRQIVSNSDDDLLRILNSAFTAFAKSPNLDLYPERFRAQVNQWNELIHDTVNNGVYKAGFATSQEAYESAVYPLFDTLDKLEDHLKENRFICGAHFTETDIRLFVTLIRFDAVYHGHFKCNLRTLRAYPNLHRHTREVYNLPGVAATVNFDHIKRHYYATHDDINPSGIVPVGPAETWHLPTPTRL